MSVDDVHAAITSAAGEVATAAQKIFELVDFSESFRDDVRGTEQVRGMRHVLFDMRASYMSANYRLFGEARDAVARAVQLLAGLGDSTNSSFVGYREDAYGLYETLVDEDSRIAVEAGMEAASRDYEIGSTILQRRVLPALEASIDELRALASRVQAFADRAEAVIATF